MGRRRPGRRGPGAAGGVFGRAAGSHFPVPAGRGRGPGASPGPGGNRTPGGRRDGTDGNRRGGSDQSRARTEQNSSTTNDPINVVTGEVLLTQHDADLGAALPFPLTRTHVSTYGAGRLFGRTWASTLDQALELDPEGVHFLDEDATVHRFPQTMVPNVAFRPVAGARRDLVLTSDGGYTLTDPRTGRTLHFPAPGERYGWSRLPLVAVTDRNGDRVDLEYEDGVLTGIRPLGGPRVAVDTAPLHLAGPEPERRVTALRLLHDADPAGTVLVRYGYDEAGNLAEVYNSSGRPLKLGYDDRDRLTGWEDRNGFWYRYTYDDEGRAVRGEGTGGLLDATLDHRPDERRTVVTDATGHATVYRYNASGQVVEEIDPLGGSVRTEWDEFDHVLSRTDPLGNIVRFAYDDVGNVTSVVHPDGSRTTAEYNELHLPTLVTQPDGTTWTMEYDERGNMTRIVDPSGAATAYEHDERGGIVGVTDPSGATYRTELDPAGRPVSITDASGTTTRYAYDALGRPASITDPSGTTVLRWTVEGLLESRVSPGGAEERWTYDAEGNAIAYTDAAGRTERTEYGPFDVPVATVRPDGARLTFTYDGELRLVRVGTPEGLAWTYEHDAAGRLRAETDFDGRTLRYAHDAAGRLVSRTNGAGQETTFVRDAFGAVVEQRSGDRVTTFAHDDMGRLVRATGGGVDLVLERDGAGRVVAEVCNGARVAVARDAAGRTVSRTTPTGVRSTWTHDVLGLPSRLDTTGLRTGTLQFSRDELGREVERRIGPGAALVQQWDPSGRLAAQAVWGAPGPADQGQARLLQHRAYGYRADGAVTTVADRLGGNRAYELDPRGRVTSVRGEGPEERYAYDGLDNVTAAEWPGGEDGAAGPREVSGTLLHRAGRVRFEYDGQGRVVLREHVTLSGARRRWRFEWDADDRLTAAEVPEGTRWYYHYDPLGRRIGKQHVAADGAVDESFAYAWDGPNLVEQVHRVRGTAGFTVRASSWDYEPGTYRPLTQLDRTAAPGTQEWVDERFHAIVADLLGSPTELVAPDGTVAWHRGSTLWGADPDGTGGAAPCPFRFPGQYFDAETGLHYNHQRYYDPGTGRYASPDPQGLDPQLNPHAYVRNPTLLTDPLGLAPYKLSSNNPVPRRLKEEYEKIKAMRAAERNGIPSPLGAPTPRVYDERDRREGRIPNGLNVGDQKVFQGHELGAQNRARWSGGLEWDVPGTDHRIVEMRDGKLGYALNHNYRNLKLFPGPWYPEGGPVR
ncbi:RHS repeat-associated core domain-containing protein [Spirillospora sp. NPDC052242]